MIRIYRTLNLLWSLKNQENRKHGAILLREYMEGVRQSRLCSMTSDTPYTGESLNSGICQKILLVTHQFSRTGAPYAVLFLARALFRINKVRPVVISPTDGPLREEFIKEGFTTIVDPLLFNYRCYSPESCDFVQNFDRIIVTSLSSVNFIRYFRGVGKRLTWWIHETDTGFDLTNMNADLPLLFAACESIWLGSPLCLAPALQYTSQDKTASAALWLYGHGPAAYSS